MHTGLIIHSKDSNVDIWVETNYTGPVPNVGEIVCVDMDDRRVVSRSFKFCHNYASGEAVCIVRLVVKNVR